MVTMQIQREADRIEVERMEGRPPSLAWPSSRMGNGPDHLACWLVLAPPLIRHPPQQIVLGPGEVGLSTTTSGRTQCTRDSLSGEPKRLSRAGGSARGIFGTRSGASTPASRFSSLSVMPVPARPA
jgi:hypothetical protein